jgi:hypothetical protein
MARLVPTCRRTHQADAHGRAARQVRKNPPAAPRRAGLPLVAPRGRHQFFTRAARHVETHLIDAGRCSVFCISRRTHETQPGFYAHRSAGCGRDHRAARGDPVAIIEKGRTQARRTTCAANLHQVGFAMISYMHDSRDHMPWATAMQQRAQQRGIQLPMRGRRGQ